MALDIQQHLKYDENIFELTATGTLTLAGFDEAEVGSVLAKGPDGKSLWLDVSNHLKRTIVESIFDINEEALDADQYIYMVKQSSPDEDDDIYDEYMIIDGKLEKVGSWAVDLSDYAKNEAIEELEDNIAELKDTLTWYSFF